MVICSFIWIIIESFNDDEIFGNDIFVGLEIEFLCKKLNLW